MNAEKQKIYQQRYRERNLDKIRTAAREYARRVMSDPVKRAERNAYRRSKTWPDRRETMKEYRAKVKAKRFFHCRAIAFNNHCKVKFAARDLASIWKRQRGFCALTGWKLTRENSHLDHIIPVGRGGTHELSNLRWTVNVVNQAKRALLDHEFIQLCYAVTANAERICEVAA
jgi:hypothetical protein